MLRKYEEGNVPSYNVYEKALLLISLVISNLDLGVFPVYPCFTTGSFLASSTIRKCPTALMIHQRRRDNDEKHQSLIVQTLDGPDAGTGGGTDLGKCNPQTAFSRVRDRLASYLDPWPRSRLSTIAASTCVFHHHRHSSPWLAPPGIAQALWWHSHDPLNNINFSGSTWMLSSVVHCSIPL